MPSNRGRRCRRWSPTRCAATSTTPTDPGNRPERGADMTTEGIEAVFLETHNWGKAARFFQHLGFELEFATGHASGQLRNGDGPYVFIAEIPGDREPQVRVVLKVPDADGCRLDPAVEVVTPFADTHYGTREMTVRDPDGRLWTLQAPVGKPAAEDA